MNPARLAPPLFWTALTALVALPVAAQTCPEVALELQQRWDAITYQRPEAEREDAYQTLVAEAQAATQAQPTCAAAWVWDGIAESTYAGAAGGLKALGAVRRARAALSEAIRLDDQVLAGAAHTTLGSLYYQSPGWPLSIGDRKLAEQHLRRALAIAPDDIDANYFYGDYLATRKRYAEARGALAKALAAPARAGREAADAGRRAQIQALVAKLQDRK